ncbi:MAG: HEAT repeat domain-containing protein [Anaerolineae bacterium]|nr:HEAT repeat domain-containing protein [Anaerolineae bacterium]
MHASAPDDIRYDVFISYAREDGRAYAERLDHDLRARGFTTWRDTRNIDQYQDFSAEIEMAIRASRFVATCITPSIEHKPNSFVRREIIYADAKNKPIIPLIFPDATPITLVNHLTWLPFYAETQRSALDYDRGLMALAARLQGEPTPEAQRATDDSHRAYLEALYDQIVYFLNQTVFSLITLRGESAPDAVEGGVIKEAPRVLPMSFFAMAGIDEPEPAKPDDQIIRFENFNDAFEHYNGRVLLLGDPGAGKTTTLFAFARDRVVARLDDPSLPLPVLAPIVGWDAEKQTPIVDWLAESVPALGRDTLVQHIEAGRVLLMLDGLDELGGERVIMEKDPETGQERVKERYDPRKRFIDAIGKIHESPKNAAAITCRVKDYTAIGEKLPLDGAITLQPLDDEQMRDYLREMPDLWEALKADDALRDIARTPLLLSLFTFAYRDQGEAAAKLRDLKDSPGDLRDAIFEQYVRRRYEHEARKPYADMQFTLEDIYRRLGKIAANNIVWNREANVLSKSHLEETLDMIKTETFLELTTYLNLIAPTKRETWHFIHLLLRDYFAFNYSLATLAGNNETDRLHVVRVLARISDPRATKILLTILNDDDVNVRVLAANALLSIGEPAVELLLAGLCGTESRIRYFAAYILGSLKDTRAIEPLIATLHDPEDRVRFYAVHALGNFKDTRVIQSLITALDDIERNMSFRAAEALTRIGTPEALAAVEEWRAQQNRK